MYVGYDQQALACCINIMVEVTRFKLRPPYALYTNGFPAALCTAELWRKSSLEQLQGRSPCKRTLVVAKRLLHMAVLPKRQECTSAGT